MTLPTPQEISSMSYDELNELETTLTECIDLVQAQIAEVVDIRKTIQNTLTVTPSRTSKTPNRSGGENHAKSLLSDYTVPFELTDSQRGLFEQLISDCAKLYLPNIKDGTVMIRNRLKDKLRYKTSHNMSYTQFQDALNLLKQAILAKNPHYFINYNTTHYVTR